FAPARVVTVAVSPMSRGKQGAGAVTTFAPVRVVAVAVSPMSRGKQGAGAVATCPRRLHRRECLSGPVHGKRVPRGTTRCMGNTGPVLCGTFCLVACRLRYRDALARCYEVARRLVKPGERSLTHALRRWTIWPLAAATASLISWSNTRAA